MHLASGTYKRTPSCILRPIGGESQAQAPALRQSDRGIWFEPRPPPSLRGSPAGTDAVARGSGGTLRGFCSLQLLYTAHKNIRESPVLTLGCTHLLHLNVIVLSFIYLKTCIDVNELFR